MAPKVFVSRLALPVAIAILTGCQTLPQSPKPKAAPTTETVSAEDAELVEEYFKVNDTRFMSPQGEFPPLTPEIGFLLVDLDRQRAYLYADGTLIAASKISSGRAHHRTETGEYAVGEKSKDHRSSVYGDFVDASGGVVIANVDSRIDSAPAGSKYQGASMKNFLRLHYEGHPTAMGLHAGKLPGHPASHGCIRLPRNASEFFFANIPLGMTVHVRGVEYGVPHGTRQPGGKSKPKTAPKPAAPEGPLSTPSTSDAAPAESATPAVVVPPAEVAPSSPSLDETGAIE